MMKLLRIRKVRRKNEITKEEDKIKLTWLKICKMKKIIHKIFKRQKQRLCVQVVPKVWRKNLRMKYQVKARRNPNRRKITEKVKQKHQMLSPEVISCVLSAGTIFPARISCMIT